MIELGFQFVSPYSAHKTLVSLVTNSEFHIPYFIGNTLEMIYKNYLLLYFVWTLSKIFQSEV